MNTYETIKNLLANYKDDGVVRTTNIGELVTNIFERITKEKGIVLNYIIQDNAQRHSQRTDYSTAMFDIDLSASYEKLAEYFPKPNGITPYFDICGRSRDRFSETKSPITNKDESDDTLLDETTYDDDAFDDGRTLGWYEPMHSPGKIVFCTDNIKNNVNGIVGALLHTTLKGMRRWDVLVFTLLLIIEDTRIHESFHYYCDVKQRLTGSEYKRDLEEALAVAHAYMETKSGFDKKTIKEFFRGTSLEFAINNYCDSASFLRNYNIIFPAILEESHKAYTLPGYCDWILYNDPSHYDKEFYDYLNDDEGKADFLRDNGINVINVPVETKMLGMKGAQVFTFEDGMLLRTEFRGFQSITHRTPSRNHEQYNLNGTYAGGKRQLVFKTITLHARTYSNSRAILADFPIRGANPIIRDTRTLRPNDMRNYFIDPSEILHLSDGDFAIYNQWGLGPLFTRFLDYATKAGYTIIVIP